MSHGIDDDEANPQIPMRVGTYDWAVQRVRDGRAAPPYEHAERAGILWNMYLTGREEDNIAEITGISPREVARDIAYMESTLPNDQLVNLRATRMKAIAQTKLAGPWLERMQELVALELPDMKELGLSPTAILKEVKEAMGVHNQKAPGVQVSIDQSRTGFMTTTAEDNRIANMFRGRQPKCQEDIVRALIAESENPIDVTPEE